MVQINVAREYSGADPGGGVLGVRTPPPPFGGPPNFIKREKMSRACARMGHILVLKSYADRPLSKILYPPLVLNCSWSMSYSYKEEINDRKQYLMFPKVYKVLIN